MLAILLAVAPLCASLAPNPVCQSANDGVSVELGNDGDNGSWIGFKHGKVVWIFLCNQSLRPPIVTSSGNFILLHEQNHQLLCIAPSGTIVWQRQQLTADQDPLPAISNRKLLVIGLGNLAMPIFDPKTEGRQVYWNNNRVYWTEAIDCDSGRTVWKRHTLNLGSSLAFMPGNRVLSIREVAPLSGYLGKKDPWLVSEYDAGTGKNLENWKVPYSKSLIDTLTDLRWSNELILPDQKLGRKVSFDLDTEGRITFDFRRSSPSITLERANRLKTYRLRPWRPSHASPA